MGLLLTGCGEMSNHISDGSSYDTRYKITCILGVQYAITSLAMDSGYAYGTTGITVLYNKDGKPLQCQVNKS